MYHVCCSFFGFDERSNKVNEEQNEVERVIVNKDRLFVTEKRHTYCVDLKTSKILWKQIYGTKQDLLADEDKLYLCYNGGL